MGAAVVHVRPGRFPLIVLGTSQRGHAVRPILPVTVRRSGGGAVLSGPWLLRASVLLQRSSAPAMAAPAEAAQWLGGVHRGWLHAQGIEDAAVYQGAAIDHWACFGGQVRGEVLVGGRKIVGIAQVWRAGSIALSAATLLAPPPWRLLCEAMRHPAAEGAALHRSTVSLQECLRRPPDVQALAGSLRERLQRACDALSDACASSTSGDGAGLS